VACPCVASRYGLPDDGEDGRALAGEELIMGLTTWLVGNGELGSDEVLVPPADGASPVITAKALALVPVMVYTGEYLAAELILGSRGLTRCSNSDKDDDG
jgi:hypothetical protein